MLVCPCSCLHHTGDHRRAAGRTHRRGHVGTFEHDSALGEGIEDRSAVLIDGVVIATEERREVFDKDPKDIGLLRSGLGKDGAKQEEKENAHGRFYSGGCWRGELFLS